MLLLLHFFAEILFVVGIRLVDIKGGALPLVKKTEKKTIIINGLLGARKVEKERRIAPRVFFSFETRTDSAETGRRRGPKEDGKGKGKGKGERQPCWSAVLMKLSAPVTHRKKHSVRPRAQPCTLPSLTHTHTPSLPFASPRLSRPPRHTSARHVLAASASHLGRHASPSAPGSHPPPPSPPNANRTHPPARTEAVPW